MPPVVTGYLLLLTFGRRGPIGALPRAHFGIVLAFNWTGAALASAIMGFPLMVRAIRLSHRGDRSCGSRRPPRPSAPIGCVVFATITLPLMLPGILAGAVLSFARALGEFGATITFVGNIPGVTQTIPTAIYTYIAGARRRDRRAPADRDFGGHRLRRAARLRRRWRGGSRRRVLGQ